MMQRLARVSLGLTVLVVLVASAASASDITWTINNVSFNPVNQFGSVNEGGAGAVTGFFVDPSGGTASGPPISGPIVNLTSWDIFTPQTTPNTASFPFGSLAYSGMPEWNPTDSTAFLETDALGNIGIGLESTANCSITVGKFQPCFTMGLFSNAPSLDPSLTPIPVDNNFGLEAAFNCNNGNFLCSEFSRNYLAGGTLTTTFVPAPEPGSLTMLGIGLGALAGLAMWKKNGLANLAS